MKELAWELCWCYEEYLIKSHAYTHEEVFSLAGNEQNVKMRMSKVSKVDCLSGTL